MLDDDKTMSIIGGGCLIKDLLHSGSGLMKGGSNVSFSNDEMLSKFLNLGIPHGLVIGNNLQKHSSDNIIEDKVIDDRLFDELFGSITTKTSKTLTKSNRKPKQRVTK